MTSLNLSRIRIAGISCLLVCLFSTSSSQAQVFQSVLSGDWEDGATWGNSSPGNLGVDYPANNDHVVISAGTTVVQTSFYRIANLDIEPNSELISDTLLRITGHYICNGIHSGVGIVRLQNGNDTIMGTGQILTTGLFRVDSKRRVLAGSDLLRKGGNFRLPNNDTVFNYGTLTMDTANLVSSATGSLFNASGALLKVNRNTIPNGILIASEPGNTVQYFREGNGNQVIADPVDGYYDLLITGTSQNSVKRIKSDLVVLNDLIVNTSTFRGFDTFDIIIGGDFTLINATFDQLEGNVLLNGTSPQVLSGAFQFDSLTVDNPTSVSITSDTVEIQGTLIVSSGTLHTNGRLKILSNSTGDGSIGASNGTISGDVVVQRYIDAGATGWRFMSSPVQNATFEDWKDDFLTTGFPGSDYPNFSFVSIYGYDETVTGDKEIGFTPPSNINNLISPGKGYFVFSGDSEGSTGAFTVEVTGPVNSGVINLGATFTSSGGASHDGWCLVGNPYPATIDWESPTWTKTNINNAIYVYNTDADQYASYIGGVGVNGGSNLIASGQAFFVQATAANPSLVITEGAKGAGTTGFLREKAEDIMVLRLSAEFEDRKAETLLRLNPGATKGYDGELDAMSFWSVDGMVELATMANNQPMSINSLSSGVLPDTVPLICKAGGTFNLHFASSGPAVSEYCISLFDAENNSYYDLQGIGMHAFTKGVSLEENRFYLIISEPEIDGKSCELVQGWDEGKESDAFAYYHAGNLTIKDDELIGNGSFFWIVSSSGQLVQSGNLSSKRLNLSHIESGMYSILIMAAHGYKKLKFIHSK